MGLSCISQHARNDCLRHLHLFRNKYSQSVTAVEEIKRAIEKLSFQERCELMAMLVPPAYDEWDEQMVKDAEAGGKLGRLRESAHEDYQGGKCRE